MSGSAPAEPSPLLNKQTVERAITPNGELVLRSVTTDDDRVEYEIIFDGVFLMATYCGQSSRDLTALALAREQTGRDELRVLIGGLGMGFTLKQALADDRVRHVTVVEIEPLIVKWNRERLGNAAALRDERTTVEIGSFLEYVESCNGEHEAIVCDIDNGPTWLVMPDNAELYDEPALELLRERLAEGGVLGFWSHERVAPFEDLLAQVVGPVETRRSVDVPPTGRALESFLLTAVRQS